MDHTKELKFALETVSKACVITSLVQSQHEKIVKHTKNDRSPVTIADYATQAYIGKALADFEPNALLAAEEDSTPLKGQRDTRLLNGIQEALQPVWSSASIQDIVGAIDLGMHDLSLIHI